MSELTDKEKIEYLEMKLEGVYKDNTLQTIKTMIGVSPQNNEEESVKWRKFLEDLYKNAFCEDPEIMYKDMIEQ